MSKECPNCRNSNRDQALFCMYCSQPLAQTCRNCGAVNQPSARFCSRCGQPLPLLTSEAKGEAGRLPSGAMLAGRYRIVRRIGKGGMGAVYEAMDTRLAGKVWAVKEMSSAALLDPLERQQALAAFQQEAQMLAHLSHPNLPRVTDYFTEQGNQYLVMEYVNGQTLEQRMQQAGGHLSESEIRPWAEQLCDVLAYLHAQQPPIIFRDLKPSNIMIEADGCVKLIDFGIARHFKPGKRADTIAFGTPGYAPPEQYGKGQTDARSDLYALGATLHHLLTGCDPSLTPFHFERVRSLNPAISPTLDAVIMRAVEPDPNQRWQTASDMGKALRARGGPSPQAAAHVAMTSSQSSAPSPAYTPTPVVRAVPWAAHALAPPLNLAGFGRRILASAIDLVIMNGVLALAIAFDQSLGTVGMISLLTLLLEAAYLFLHMAISGKTVGKAIMGIKVVKGDGSPPGWLNTIFRYLGWAVELGIGVGLIGWLWALFDKSRQTWHDKVSGTYVVRG